MTNRSCETNVRVFNLDNRGNQTFSRWSLCRLISQDSLPMSSRQPAIQ